MRAWICAELGFASVQSRIGGGGGGRSSDGPGDLRRPYLCSHFQCTCYSRCLESGTDAISRRYVPTVGCSCKAGVVTGQSVANIYAQASARFAGGCVVRATGGQRWARVPGRHGSRTLLRFFQRLAGARREKPDARPSSRAVVTVRAGAVCPARWPGRGFPAGSCALSAWCSCARSC